MSRAKPLDPEDRRATLLLAARRVFAAKGYHAAGVSDVVEAAGVARGTFYNHFDSKRAIFQAVLADLIAEVEGVVQPIDVAQPIPQQVDANLRRMFAVVTRPDLGRLLFAEALGLDDECDAALRDFYDRALARMARAIDRGKDLGVVRPCDSALVARLIIGMIKEPAFQAMLHGEPVDQDAVIAELAAMLWVGVVRR